MAIGLVIADFAVAIAPTAENGCSKPCWAMSHLVGDIVQGAPAGASSRITLGQLTAIRRQIALAVGIDD